jgi:hypothetical protein
MKFKYPTDFDVYWEEWIDAYDNEETDKFKEYLKEYGSQEEDELFNDDDPVGYDSTLPPFQQPIKSIFTPYGIMPLTEQSMASKHFKFWTGHTNFKIEDEHVLVIEDCEGVETVDVLTPVRFRLGIGKLFKDREVMFNVKTALVKYVKYVKTMKKS